MNEDAGKFYSVDNILKILERERIFFRHSGGGVTFSGGEPMMQFDFLLEALKACKANGYHTAVDTSGYSSAENFKAVIPFTDLFLFDIKHLDDPIHLLYTGVSNRSIIDNFRIILESGRELVVRIPVVPRFNDDMDHLSRLKQFIIQNKRVNITKINLLPYHKIGSSKYRKFNIPYKMDDVQQPSAQKMKELKEFFTDIGVKIKIGG